MASYICTNCHHELHADDQTLLYMISHPPKCTQCGYDGGELRDAKQRQFKMQIARKGFRRTVRLYDAMYHCGREQAEIYLRQLSPEQSQQAVKVKAKRSGLAIMWLIISVSVGAGFLPVVIEFFTGPDTYVRDLSYVPNEQGGLVWVLRTTGEDDHEIRIKAIDPVSEKRMMKTTIEAEYPVTAGEMTYHNGKVWVICNNYSQQGMIYVLNAADGSVLMNTDQFLSSGGSIRSGLAQLQYNAPWSLRLTGKDGTAAWYHIEHDQFFDDQSVFYRFEDSVRNQGSGYFELRTEGNSGQVNNLYFVSGSPNDVQIAMPAFDPAKGQYDYLSDGGSIVHKRISELKLLTSSIVYKDHELCVISHVSELGADGEILFSAFDIKGRQLFSVKEADCLPDFDWDDEDAPYRPAASRYEKCGKLFLITFGVNCISAIDTESGEISWTYWTD